MKSRVLSVVFGLAACVTVPLAHAINDASMVLYLPFEEGAGTTAGDLSPRKNNGSILGGAAWTTGKIGKALQFNGTDSVVEIPSNASLQSDEGPLTIEAWIQADPTSAQWARVVDKFYGTGYVLGRRGGDMVIGGEFTGTPNSFASTTVIFDNQWRHVALTREVVGGVNVLNLYIDGKLENTIQGGAPNQHNMDTTPVRIGAGDECCAEGGTAAYWFKGIIDEVAIYKKVLTPAEIAADMVSILSTTAVEPNGKLATTWASMRAGRE